MPLLINRTVGRLRGEAGSVAILFAVGMTSLMAFLAIVVEVGLIHAEKTNLQVAADAAALAGVQSLPGNPAQAVLDAQAWAAKNVDDLTFNDAVVVDGNRIEVTVRRNASGVFNGTLSLGRPEVEATASAQTVGSGLPYAIFGIGDACGGGSWPVRVGGSTNVINGGAHSNGRFRVNGSSNDFGSVTHVCDADVNGSNNTFTSGPTETGPEPTPLEPPDLAPYFAYLANPATCTFELTGSSSLNSYPQFWQGGDPGSGQLLPGIYCSGGDISLSGSDVSGNVTFIAEDDVTISGSNGNLQAFINGTLAFADGGGGGGDAIRWSGSDGQWTGDLLAANGDIRVSGSDATWSGDVYAAQDEIRVSGSRAQWTGNLFAPSDTVAISGSDTVATGMLVGDEVDISGSGNTVNYDPNAPGAGAPEFRLVA